MKELLIKIIRLKIEYLSRRLKYYMNQTENSKRLYIVAKNLLYPQRDVTPDDIVPDEVACAEALSYVLKLCGVQGIPRNGIPSTIDLFKFLSSSEQFIKVETPLAGDVIISVTGTGNGRLVGHCGIVGVVNVMNNNSETGIWVASYTLTQWEKRYKEYAGMATHYFRFL